MTFDPAFTEVTALGLPARHRAVTFGELVDRYVANPSREVSPKTRTADQEHDSVLLDILGRSTPLALIDRDACRRVQSIVQRLPANFTKLSPKWSPKKVVEHAETHGMRPIAAKTAKTYLGALAGSGPRAVPALPCNPFHSPSCD